jgi:hypothetical protein
VEPLDLAIGLGPVGAGPLQGNAQPSCGLGEDDRLGRALALSVSTRWTITPCSAKNPAAWTKNRAAVAPVSSGRIWLKATRERSSTAEWM